jgi:lysophospholipase L1-like esterase
MIGGFRTLIGLRKGHHRADGSFSITCASLHCRLSLLIHDPFSQNSASKMKCNYAFSIAFALSVWRALACTLLGIPVVCVAGFNTPTTLPPDLALTARPAYQTALARQHIADFLAAPNAPVILGDSIMFYIPGLTATFPSVVNLAIVGDTTSGILARLPNYRSLSTATVVVLEGGVNDMFFDAGHDATVIENYRRIINTIANQAPIALLGAFPVDENVQKAQPGWNTRINRIDDHIFSLCRANPRCTAIDLRSKLIDADGNLRVDYHRENDGIHPNAKAYDEVIVPALRSVLLPRK